MQPSNRSCPYPIPSSFKLLVALWFAWESFPYASQGDELGTFIFLFTAALSVYFTLRWLNALDACSDRKQAKDRLASFSNKQGEAKLGGPLEAKVAGLTSLKGLQLGVCDGKRITYAGSNHVWIAGPPGSGKGTGPFGVTGLTSRVGDDSFGDPFSQFWNDPALETFCLLNKQQRAMGRRVVVVCGEPDRLKRELGIQFDAVRINPATIMDSESDTVVDDARMLAMLVFPGQPAEKRSGNSGHFEETARSAIKTHALDELSTEGVVTLPALQSRLAGPQTPLIAAMLKNDAYDGAVSEGAAKLESIMVDSPEEWSGVMSTVARALELYDGYSPYGKSVSDANWDWSMMKKEPTAVFLCNSADRALAHAGHKNLMLGSAIESLARVRTRRRVTFFLDECAGLRYLPTLPHAMAEYRKFGQQYVLGWQQFSQAQRIYGRDLAREMLGMCEVVLAMNTREASDCKMLSEMVGSTNQATASQSLNFESGGGPPQVSYNGSYQSQPVLRPEALRNETAIERQKVVVAIRERQQRLVADRRVSADTSGSLYAQLETLDHTRARLKATDTQIDEQLKDLDAKRRPFVQTQQRLLEQIDANVAAQHEAHFDPPKRVTETEPMKVPGPDEFHRVSTIKEKTPERAAKPLASTERLQALKNKLSQPKPAPELRPPGMSPNLAKRVKQDKAIGDEIVRIQKALNARRGQARDGFGRSAGG